MKRDYTFYNEAQNAAFDFMVATIKDKQISCREDLRFEVEKNDDGTRSLRVWEEKGTGDGAHKALTFFATCIVEKANALELSCVLEAEHNAPVVIIWNSLL